MEKNYVVCSKCNKDCIKRKKLTNGRTLYECPECKNSVAIKDK